MAFLFTVFVSAFLLFLIQPMLAKMMLPFFGGGAAVWTACMLFFQLFLLLGYSYAHLLTKLLRVKYQVIIHCVLISTGLFMMPVIPLENYYDLVQGSPLISIINLLLIGIGLPYFLLSATAPLIQKWYSFTYPNRSPYKLYALSNLGSFLALFTYPFAIEPSMEKVTQADVWSIGYVVFSCFIFVVSFKVIGFKKRSKESTKPATDKYLINQNRKNIAAPLLWLSLSATGVILLLSTTHVMTQNIPPTPFLWLLPLGIYLLTYIICFNNENTYVRWYWLSFFIISSAACVFMFFIGTQFDIVSQIVLYTFILLSASMICQGELARLKPKASELTWFYLVIAAGGVIGSLFITVVAEKLLTQYLEYPIGILLVYVLLALILTKEMSDRKEHINLLSFRNRLGLFNIVGLAGFVLLFAFFDNLYSQHDIYRSRNFYGILAVKDIESNAQPERRLVDGSTSHGTQSLLPEYELIPMSYYRYGTGVGIALQENVFESGKKVGVIGLGAGTLASYGVAGDNYIFYELNPDVEKIAINYFTYLSNSKANVSVTLGDARISLQNEYSGTGSQYFQVLIVDAFLSDSIPMHLLTFEAFQLYTKHLAKDGMLVLHISSTHFDLLPLVGQAAAALNMQALHFLTPPQYSNEHTAEWVVLTNNQKFIANQKVQHKSKPVILTNNDTPIWTDDFSNLLSVLKFGSELN